MPFLKTSLDSSYVALRGHTSRVNCLLYPHSLDVGSYGENLLYSGSDDFSVKIWDWQREMILQTFTVHSGPVVKFLIPPSNTAVRIIMSPVFCILFANNRAEAHAHQLYSSTWLYNSIHKRVIVL